MPRTMQKIVPVKIAADATNCYATIMRSCISAATAALRLKDAETAQKFTDMRKWASDKYDESLEASFAECGNPAKG